MSGKALEGVSKFADPFSRTMMCEGFSAIVPVVVKIKC
jgi:hypothetical protein